MHCTCLSNNLYGSVRCCSNVTRCGDPRVLYNDRIWDLLFRDRLFFVAELYYVECVEKLCVSSELDILSLNLSNDYQH